MAKIPGSRLIVFGASIALLGSICMGVMVMFFLYWIFWGVSSESNKKTDAAQATVQAAAVASAPVEPSATSSGGVAASASSEEKMVSGREAGKALSKYMQDLSSSLAAQQFIQQSLLSKVQQAYEFRDLDKYVAAAEELKESALKGQEDVQRTQFPGDLADEDIEYINAIGEAAGAVMAVRVDMAVDVSAEAHTGMGMLNRQEIEKLKRDKREADKALTQAVRKAYQHFGYSRKEVNWDTYTLKD
ncbi:hypothetical protein BUE93_20880 [Chromobacterium amazonense]|uniref:Uncharacterized protein n=1 Tax=Chromobacterium amazonense TaxID=1382803 RepID=A0A2S9WZ31_9NEIS|nr:hypothetical protein BUE93_20880 [Chromobacterium amazonense]